MEKELAQALVEIITTQLGTEAEVYEGYSGRGMYGETTTGITINHYNDLIVAVYLLGCEHGQENNEISEDLSQLNRDSMGRDSIIVY